jgi:hypothetical protein
MTPTCRLLKSARGRRASSPRRAASARGASPPRCARALFSWALDLRHVEEAPIVAANLPWASISGTTVATMIRRLRRGIGARARRVERCPCLRARLLDHAVELARLEELAQVASTRGSGRRRRSRSGRWATGRFPARPRCRPFAEAFPQGALRSSVRGGALGACAPRRGPRSGRSLDDGGDLGGTGAVCSLPAEDQVPTHPERRG